MKIMKKVLASLTAGVICLMGTPLVSITLFISMTASAEDTLTEGVLMYEVNDEGTITITNCDETAEEIEIPAEINGIAVTEIGYYAFFGCTSLTSIMIPESVPMIGSNTFYDCISLADVYYAGTEEQWNAIEIDEYGNGPLTTATIHVKLVTVLPV